jgi:hypothetical protein
VKETEDAVSFIMFDESELAVGEEPLPHEANQAAELQSLITFSLVFFKFKNIIDCRFNSLCLVGWQQSRKRTKKNLHYRGF